MHLEKRLFDSVALLSALDHLQRAQYIFVYTTLMQNITFSAQNDLIAQARELAKARGTTLNEEFRVWLSSFVQQQGKDEQQARMRNIIDQITAPTTEQRQLVALNAYTPAHLRQPVRDDFNEREQRMLKRLGQ